MTESSFLPYCLKDCLLPKMPCLNSLFRILFCHPLSYNPLSTANSMEILPSSPRTEMQGNECQSTLLSICLSIPPGDFHLLTISIILYRQCKCKLQLNPCANSLPLYLIRCDGESWLPAWLAWGMQRKSGKHISEIFWWGFFQKWVAKQRRLTLNEGYAILQTEGLDQRFSTCGSWPFWGLNDPFIVVT